MNTIPILLNRARPCDFCGEPLEVGDAAHLGRSRSMWTCACPACVVRGPLAVPDPLDELRATARRALQTARVVVRTAVRWLLGRLGGERNAGPIAVRTAFEDLGTTYVKLGQLVASSDGMFPEAYCRELRACLDRARPFDFQDVTRTIESELGRRTTEVFAEIDPAPLASASIAQVHAARLRNGEEVVIKVQRPGLPPILGADLAMLRFLARRLERHRHVEMANPVGVVEDFASTLAEELDFTREAASMQEFNRIMRVHGHHDVVAPRPVFGLSRPRVLVMERFHGQRVDEVRDVNGEAKLLSGMRAWFRCLVFHGFFHGDVHAGNLMALDDGRIGFLDFGIVGRFTARRREQITDYLLAFATGDFERVVDVMIAMGSAPTAVDRAALADDLRVSFEPVLSGGNAKYADMLPAIMRTSARHGLRLPREMVLVSKQMIYFDRYARVLAPELNVFRDPRVVMALAEDVMAARATLPR